MTVPGWEGFEGLTVSSVSSYGHGSILSTQVVGVGKTGILMTLPQDLRKGVNVICYLLDRFGSDGGNVLSE